jgi:hypothetical protein
VSFRFVLAGSLVEERHRERLVFRGLGGDGERGEELKGVAAVFEQAGLVASSPGRRFRLEVGLMPALPWLGG